MPQVKHQVIRPVPIYKTTWRRLAQLEKALKDEKARMARKLSGARPTDQEALGSTERASAGLEAAGAQVALTPDQLGQTMAGMLSSEG